MACLTTSVGLITACSSFFHELFPNISYKKIAVVLSVFSTLVANIRLTQLIKANKSYHNKQSDKCQLNWRQKFSNYINDF
ncbi:branched-chain amino acid transport system II carrier protein [Bacillus subtilis]|uniref:Branched-chain amino acid transport system carrier protein n=1 Tax=Bacillus subtilis TaxID=1423 RepID=A0AAX3RU49_BACIU|nr:branched-chain amino acid transport system II carrier protein [Bacillus subtilis]MED3625992.1 branched-chain amino acid transport system II carrier protein [Bacillus subtilis]MED3695686.1 branched-chain amino acid transport system II carrier protein [Bacillus subtilis]WEY86497.1 branched-chain amino acid transport system II carrier protein [Bacillus subtilis]WEY96959.1 branched-chain amino acid transport system II carrier protein [Bacillus subtilis]